MVTSSAEWLNQIKRPYRVLVIDDDDIIHLSLKRLLDKLPFTTRCVHSPSLGLEFATTYSWDLVLLDLMMPEMNGFDLLKAMRAANVTTPVVVITAYPSPRRAGRALRLGAVDFVPKPFTRDELLGAISVALLAPAS